MPKTTMKLSEIKPKVTAQPPLSRDILIQIGFSLTKKVAKSHAQELGAVKCTDLGNGNVQFEWSGPAKSYSVEEWIRY